MKINKLIIFCLGLGLCVQASVVAQTGAPDKKKATAAKVDTAKKVSAYAKIFEDKTFTTSRGLMTLHSVEGKVYVELPAALLERRLLLWSNIERISDPKWGYVGQRVSNYSQIIFSRTDSMALIRLVNRGVLPVADDTEQGMKTALSRSNIPPVIIVTPIIAMSPDRTAIVFAPGGAFTMRFPLRYNWARVGLHSTPFLC